jgi:hypothetical protein
LSHTLFLALLLLTSPHAFAQPTPLPVDVGWKGFNWTSAPVGTQVAQFSLGTTTLTELRVVDAYQNGDMFKIQVNGSSSCSGSVIFTVSTSPVSNPRDWDQLWNDKDSAWKLDGIYSGLSLTLEPGSYTITISIVQSALDGTTGQPINAGKAYVRASTNSTSLSCWPSPPAKVPGSALKPLQQTPALSSPSSKRAVRHPNGADDDEPDK